MRLPRSITGCGPATRPSSSTSSARSRICGLGCVCSRSAAGPGSRRGRCWIVASTSPRSSRARRSQLLPEPTHRFPGLSVHRIAIRGLGAARATVRPGVLGNGVPLDRPARSCHQGRLGPSAWWLPRDRQLPARGWWRHRLLQRRPGMLRRTHARCPGRRATSRGGPDPSDDRRADGRLGVRGTGGPPVGDRGVVRSNRLSRPAVDVFGASAARSRSPRRPIRLHREADRPHARRARPQGLPSRADRRPQGVRSAGVPRMSRPRAT